MSQVTDYLIPGTPLTMAALAEVLEDAFAASVSCNRGAAAPANPAEGMLWWDISAAPIETLKRYTVDSGWIALLSISTATGAVLTIAGRTIGGSASTDIVVNSMLGTAAAAVLQTAADDNTAGRVLTVGAFGCGGVVTYNGNLNSLIVPGTYYAGAAATNKPVSNNGWCTVKAYTDDYIKQVYEPYNSNAIWTRRKQVTWQAWAEVA